MSDALRKELQEKLNEEKWTRAALTSYSVTQFKELDDLIERIRKAGWSTEALQICEEHLEHTKHSIVALYISGILKIEKRAVDDEHLVSLIQLFIDQRKWKIVEYLCQRVLEYGENRFALKTLAHWYETEGREADKVAIWERLIKVDYEEADLVKTLAEKKLEQGSTEEAVDLYKKALHRYIGKGDFPNVKEIWERLLTLAPQDISFFDHAESKIVTMLGEEKAIQLLYLLYEAHKDAEEQDIPISILKQILSYDPRDTRARKALVEAYRKKYAGHSNLEEYLKISNLTQNWRNVHEAIEDFERHIAFDEGNFVYHRTWGVGRIRSIKGDEVVIDFVKKRGHKMSLQLAIDSLQVLDKRHIWVLKAVSSKEKLKKMFLSNVRWGLEVVIKSLENNASIRDIKSELVPSILSSREWTEWSERARELLKTDPMFGNVPNRSDRYMVRSHPVTFEEKIYLRFKAEKNFFARLKTMEEYLQQGEPDSEFFNEMLEYFISFLKGEEITETTICSGLFLSRLLKQYPYLGERIQVDLLDLFSRLDAARTMKDVFAKIQDQDYRRLFLEFVKHNLPGWPKIFKDLFPQYLNRYIIESLHDAGRTDVLQELVDDLFDRYKEEREAFIWLIRNYLDEEWFRKTFELSFERILINFLHLLDITYREIENAKNVVHNRKLNKQVYAFLFQEQRLEQYLLHASEEEVIRIYSLVEDVEGLDPATKIELRHLIMEHFPGIKLPGREEREVVVPRGIMVTPAAYAAKQKELKYLHEVEVPKNSKEISQALLLGDLRENAEYKAAKERQEMLNSTIGKLKEELERAQIVRPDEVDASQISFGTKVTLLNKETKKRETYVILGPWESNPDKGIISYLSPFGSELYGHKEGEELEFTINERTYHYVVEKIEKADMS